ncbi:ABC transporter permease [Mucilaginibacter sp. RS28]|uniref:ABC transporter permease n=1 Tax=Mucilaginibacter straminoryzae TaxID=2932774 RepID=A0A9X2B9M1_9SPHI|nr:ABC transporter permease [Mucilaginibacter straminoryzae]MCJ8209880.1 ABC transporter permease [Mucilaginibacter straminoryzae]
MNKVLLIIQREYLTRVKKRSFVIMIFVVPLLILAMGAVIKFIAKKSGEITSLQTVNVVDSTGAFAGQFHNVPNIKFQTLNVTLAQAKLSSKENEDVFTLYIPAKFNPKAPIQIYSKKKPPLPLTTQIEKQMNDIAIANSFKEQHIDTAIVNHIRKTDISVSPVELTETGDKKTSMGANIGVGISCAILIYMSIFIYGAQVMRGVIEEKTNRIIEVVISSVKPFQLMLGKIIGVGLVGLTQFGAWTVLSVVAAKVAGQSSQVGIMNFLSAIQTIPFGFILGCFVFYFTSGYLLYSALFAAVGSAVDSETETQQFMFPITLPLLFTYILSVSVLFQAPNSPLAVWLSIIPFTAPVAMMVRLPFDPPVWQIAVSMALMVVGFLFTTYVASRIYRVGVLMYGKKASFKELSKWFFYKE